MKTSSVCFRSRLAAAFTLIELLTVMAIIIILAGLILGTAGFAQRKAAMSRAQGEIKALEAAINAYQVDNGAVPRSADYTDVDAIDPRKLAGASGTSYGDSAYQASSRFLFKALSGYFDLSTSDTVPSATRQKTYFPFKGSQLPTLVPPITNPDGSLNISTTTAAKVYIVDPFGVSYGYSTAAVAEAEKNAQAGSATTTAQTKGFNPTFDLWSTAGWGSGGKKYPTNGTDRSIYWINNWSSQ